MATKDAYRQFEYKMCAMNGVPLGKAIQGSMYVEWQRNALWVDIYLGKVAGGYEYERVEYEIIAVPHEWREFWRATATLT